MFREHLDKAVSSLYAYFGACETAVPHHRILQIDSSLIQMRDSAVDAVAKLRRVSSGEDQVADEFVRCDRRTTVLKKQTKNSLC